MIDDLYKRLEDAYDPTDADLASRVAHMCLRLMRVSMRVQYAVEHGMLVGRDDSSCLTSATVELAEALKIIEKGPSIGSVRRLFDTLLGFPPDSYAPADPISKSFSEIGAEVGKLVEEKNAAYGDSFNKSGNVLRQLYPDGVSPEQYDDLLASIRIIDKLFRLAADSEAFGESPGRDIAGYGILIAARHERRRTDA